MASIDRKLIKVEPGLQGARREDYPPKHTQNNPLQKAASERPSLHLRCRKMSSFPLRKGWSFG